MDLNASPRNVQPATASPSGVQAWCHACTLAASASLRCNCAWVWAKDHPFRVSAISLLLGSSEEWTKHRPGRHRVGGVQRFGRGEKHEHGAKLETTALSSLHEECQMPRRMADLCLCLGMCGRRPGTITLSVGLLALECQRDHRCVGVRIVLGAHRCLFGMWGWNGLAVGRQSGSWMWRWGGGTPVRCTTTTPCTRPRPFA